FNLPIVPDACRYFDGLMIALSLIAIVYIGFIAIAQTDMKKLIAYSSVAHMGFVTLGSFMVYVVIAHTGNIQDAYLSLEGALVQMISHSFGAGAMFLAFGVLYEQLHTRLIHDFGGIAKPMPLFAAFFMLFAMSNVGLPGTSGFVGEFMVIMSAFQTHFWVAAFASLTLILSASYTLWMYKRVFFGPVGNEYVAQFKDVTWPEKINYILLTMGVFFFGLYPQPIINVLRVTIGHLLLQSMPPNLAFNATPMLFS